MPFRHFLAALVALSLAACSDNQENSSQTEEGATVSDSSSEDPFVAHFPWDENKDGVVTTDSGLQYLVLESGDSSASTVKPSDQVTVHYDGRLAATGQQFDSSYGRGAPATFPANALIPGWVEALQLMRPGDEWLLYIPSNLGYGARGAPPDIPPNADLIFRLNVLAIGG